MLLSQKDIDYLEKLQKDYENSIAYYRDKLDFMDEWIESAATNKNFLTKTTLENEIHNVETKSINRVTIDFINIVLNYIKNTYGLSSIDSNLKNKTTQKYVKYEFSKYNNDNLKYTDIVGYICCELNITEFKDKEKEDLSKRLYNQWKYDFQNDRITIKSEKVKISDYGVILSYSAWGNEVGLDDRMRNIFLDINKGMNYKTNLKLEENNTFTETIGKLIGYGLMPQEELFTTHDINALGVKSIRIFKNHSLEVKFINNSVRDKFIEVIKGEI